MQWDTILPIALLGNHTSLNDLHCMTAELVYGTTLRLPGKIFSNCLDMANEDPSQYVNKT